MKEGVLFGVATLLLTSYYHSSRSDLIRIELWYSYPLQLHPLIQIWSVLAPATAVIPNSRLQNVVHKSSINVDLHVIRAVVVHRQTGCCTFDIKCSGNGYESSGCPLHRLTPCITGLVKWSRWQPCAVSTSSVFRRPGVSAVMSQNCTVQMSQSD